MKTIWLSLVLFSSVFLLSSALPGDWGKDHNGLLDSNQENEKPLQRRRPPVKIPGPKLKNDEESYTIKTLSEDEGKGKKKGKKDAKLTKDKHMKEIASPDDDSKESKRGEKGKRGKGKDKDLVRRDERYEETQEERNGELP